MPGYLLIAALVILACVIFNKISGKIGVPALLAFIILGMILGSDGIFKIPFENYQFAEQICTIALIFIMFYGGAGVRISQAKKVMGKSILLSTLGVLLTALFVGLFCHYVLKIGFFESFLIGSVISSTDAASVFSILRSKKLSLKYNTASLLEMESGSNDPFSYMLTILVLSFMEGKTATGSILYMLFAQVFFGAACGVLVAWASMIFLKKHRFHTEGFDAVFIVAVALISYALPACIGGNGYLSAYITGIILGNTEIRNRRSLIHFFDGVTGLMQLLCFFLLGLLAFPSQFDAVALPGLLIALFITFVARPLAVFLLLTPFKCPINQQLLISWSGLRGAASIVFAILAVVSPVVTDNDIFHIVFFIVLFSILIQGTLLPFIAKKLNMTDLSGDVMKTFTDYTYELPVSFIKLQLSEKHKWVGEKIKNIGLPPGVMVTLIIRNHEKIVPNGETVLKPRDTLFLGGESGDSIEGLSISEHDIDEGDSRIGKKLSELPQSDELIIMIKRNGRVIIPHGKTVIKEDDVIIHHKK